jgi:hypothetical protein
VDGCYSGLWVSPLVDSGYYEMTHPVRLCAARAGLFRGRGAILRKNSGTPPSAAALQICYNRS